VTESADAGNRAKVVSKFAQRLLAIWLVPFLLGNALMPLRASADSAPIKIAVFDFELDDFSAASGIAGDKAADAVQLDRVTSEVRRLIGESKRYVLVDVSAADGPAVKEHSLAQCDGCDAPIAQKLGAEQSLVGVVTRISRTDYVVRFEIRDARTGEVVVARQSDLRAGADYSWYRGAASLIRDSLLVSP